MAIKYEQLIEIVLHCPFPTAIDNFEQDLTYISATNMHGYVTPLGLA